ncbi:uncharacterized protein LOC120107099 [Phoenix dactylifera]|nr:uncharacterized protein LOC120107099 [Phoenix dactylifera]
MHRGKRFRDVEFQQSQVGSSSAQSMRSQQPQQHESESQHEFQSQQHPGQEVMDDLHIQDEQGRVRLTRGSSRARDVWQLREDEKMVVECNELGQPIKRAGSLLSSFLGSVARRGQLCPLNYHK